MNDTLQQDTFEMMARRLERLVSLKELLDESDYQEMRSTCLSQMKETILPAAFDTNARQISVSPPRYRELPYAQLHARIVSKIGANYENAGENERERLLRSLNIMAENQALFPGDSEKLTKIVDIVVDPKGINTNSNNEQLLSELLGIVGDLNDVRRQIGDNQNSSPAAKAIAETAHQSAHDAAREIRKSKLPATNAATFVLTQWKKWALPDIVGAFEGGSAASEIAGAFSPLSVPLAVAIGVLLVGGVKSAEAHGQSN